MREVGSQQIKKRIDRILSPVFRAKDTTAARAMYHVACDMLRDCCPRSADVAEEAKEMILASLALAEGSRRRRMQA